MIKTYGDRQPGLGTSAIVGALTLAKTGTTARTATFPDAAITVAGQNIDNAFSLAQTFAGSVPGTPSAGQVMIGGGAVKAGTAVYGADGSAAAPGLRTTTYAHGLYSAASTILGFAVGGVATLQVASPGGGIGAGFRSLTTADGDYCYFLSDRANAELRITAGNTTTNGANLQLFGSGHATASTGRLRVSGTSVLEWTATGITAAQPITVPNGTAAAPGIKTSEGHGLYRNSATTLGIAAAGLASVAFAGANGSTFGGAIILQTPSAAEFGSIFAAATNSYVAISGSSGTASGGQLRAYGSTHATKPNYVEFTRASTVSAYFDGSGILTANNTTDATTTSDGSVRLSGGLSVAKNIVTGQSALFTAATAAGTTAGQLQRETNQDKLYAYTNAIGGWLDKCIFSQYASVTQSGIVTDQSLASATARGTRTLPANFFKAGKVLKFRLCGRYTTDAAAGNATIQIKLGTTVFRTSGSFALDNSVTNLPWELEGEITCLTTGASGTVEGISLWKHMITGATGNYDAEALAGTTSVTLDTTASQTFDVVWTADDAGTAITCTCFRLWEVC